MESNRSNQTTVRTGPLLPVLSAPAAGLEAHRRAPTLLAGQAPGSQGAVQVWAPEKWRLRLPVAGWAALLILMLFDLFIRAHDRFHWLFAIARFQYVAYAAASLAVLRFPTYVTTDDAGIGLTGWKQPPCALLWGDIFSVETVGLLGFDREFRIRTLGDEKPISISLSGYPRAVRRRLLDLILSRAQLVPAGYQARMYIPSRDRYRSVSASAALPGVPAPG